MHTSSVEIRSKIAVVVGGASGLGEATAIKLGECGATVVVADRSVANGERVAAHIGGLFIPCDVTDEVAVEQLFEQASAAGQIGAVVNCAGIGPPRRLIDRNGEVHPLKPFDLIMRVNLYGTFNVLRYGAAAMARNEPNADGERGVIINTSSTSAVDGQIGQVAFAAAKGGIAALTLPAARDLAVLGIRVCAIIPGLMDTPAAETMSEENRQSIQRSMLFPARFGRPEEYAALAAHIISNAFMNAEVVRLDAGLRTPAK